MSIPPIDSLVALGLVIVLFGVGRSEALRAELGRVVGVFRTGLQSGEQHLDGPIPTAHHETDPNDPSRLRQA